MAGRDRPRVLVEAADGAEAFARVQVLEKHGYDAAWCPGPPEAVASRCPLVAGDECPLAGWADLVVTSLGLDHPAGREVLEALRRHHPELPVVVEATQRDAADWAFLVDGHRVLSSPPTAEALIGAVAAELDSLEPGPA